jgi:hypothetical protein
MMLALPQDKRLAMICGDALPPPLGALAAAAAPAKKPSADCFAAIPECPTSSGVNSGD